MLVLYTQDYGLQVHPIAIQYSAHNIAVDLRCILIGHWKVIITLSPLHSESAPKDSSLPRQLLTFCREVADGMSYLARKGYIHRDLAARNVLLDKRLKCKVHMTICNIYSTVGRSIADIHN